MIDLNDAKQRFSIIVFELSSSFRYNFLSVIKTRIHLIFQNNAFQNLETELKNLVLNAMKYSFKNLTNMTNCL